MPVPLLSFVGAHKHIQNPKKPILENIPNNNGCNCPEVPCSDWKRVHGSAVPQMVPQGCAVVLNELRRYSLAQLTSIRKKQTNSDLNLKQWFRGKSKKQRQITGLCPFGRPKT